MRILIADTNETFLEKFQAHLWDNGFDAEITMSGLQCCAILDRCRPDIIVIEQELLWGECEGVITKLQSDPELSSIPIVVLVGEPREEWEGPTNPRVVAWIEKPFQLSESWCQIQSVLVRQNPPQPPNSRERRRELSH